LIGLVSFLMRVDHMPIRTRIPLVMLTRRGRVMLGNAPVKELPD
jgi:hypothetical protein